MPHIARALALALTAVLAAAGAAGAAEAIKIGLITPGQTAVAEFAELNGATLAAGEINKAGGVLGRPIELVVEHAEGTAASAVAAFGRLAARPEVVASIGLDRSAFVHALAADVAKAGRPMMIGGTDPKLTRMGNPWLFRCRPNDTYSAKAVAEFGVNTLKARRWAIAHVEDQFGTSARDALAGELKRLGVEPVATPSLTSDIRDAAALAQTAKDAVRVAKDAGADLIVSYVFPNHVAPLAEQIGQSGAGITWIGSPRMVGAEVPERVRPALDGAYAVTDFIAGSSPAAEAFARRYEAAHGRPAGGTSAWTFDAVNLLARAIKDAGGTEPDRIRAALLAIRGHEGVEGTYSFDLTGDGLRGYNLVRNEGGRWVFVRRFEFQD